MLHSSTGLGQPTLPFKLKPGENLLYLEEYIPYVVRNDTPTINPDVFRLFRCFYCGGSKPDAVRWGGEIIHRLMYFDIVPLPNRDVTTTLRQISICNDCMEWII